jgi:hypothetical protein
VGQAGEQQKLGLHYAKVHSFRITTAILTWVLLGVMLVYKPEWIRNGMRVGTPAIETVGNALPNYWGAQAEIVLRELGGFLGSRSRQRSSLSGSYSG